MAATNVIVHRCSLNNLDVICHVMLVHWQEFPVCLPCPAAAMNQQPSRTGICLHISMIDVQVRCNRPLLLALSVTADAAGAVAGAN